jgi:hypothetical protein
MAFGALMTVLATVTPAATAAPTPTNYDVGCQNNVQSGVAQAATGLAGTAPSSATPGTPFTVTGLQVTAALPAALIQAGVGLHILHDGQVVNGTISVSIAAAGATPASVDLSGPGSGTISAPGGVAAPLTIITNLPDTQWTPSGPGTVTLALGKTGDLHQDGVTSTNGANAITDGSVQLGAAIFGASPDVFLVCKPGTVNGTTFTPASSTASFASIPVNSPTTTTTQATTTTTHATTTTTIGGTTTTTSGGTTTTTGATTSTTGATTTTTAPTTTTTQPSTTTTTSIVVGSQNYDIGCQNNVQAGFSQAEAALSGAAPSSASVGSPFTVHNLQVTASLPAPLISAGVGLGVLHDGQTVNGTVSATIAAVGATPASVDLSGPGSGTIHAPGGVAQPLSITVNLPDTQWTPTASTVTLALGKTGDLKNDGVTSANGASAITDGSVELGAAVFGASPDVFLVCKPGTVDSGGAFTAASSTPPFVTVGGGGGTTTTTIGGTTTTTSGGTTTTSAGGGSVSGSASQASPGGTLTLNGTGFKPNDTLTITLHSDPVTLGTVTADPSGAFSTVVTIPADTAPGAHTIVVSGTDGKTATFSLTVVAAVTATTAATAVLGAQVQQSSTPLAFTGLDAKQLLLVGLLFLLSGAFVVLTSAKSVSRRPVRR